MEGRAGAGALGPRLAGRLTAELILRSPQYMSCVKDYEIDLRGVPLHPCTAGVTRQHADKYYLPVMQGTNCLQ